MYLNIPAKNQMADLSDMILAITLGAGIVIGTMYVTLELVDKRYAHLESKCLCGTENNKKTPIEYSDITDTHPIDYSDIHTPPQTVQPMTDEQIQLNNKYRKQDMEAVSDSLVFVNKARERILTEKDKAEFKEKYPIMYAMFESDNFIFPGMKP
jgi:hypothetical protein